MAHDYKIISYFIHNVKYFFRNKFSFFYTIRLRGYHHVNTNHYVSHLSEG